MQSTMNFNVPLPPSGILFGGDLSKEHVGQVAEIVSALGFKIYCAGDAVKEYLKKYVPSTCEVGVIEFPKNDKRKLREVFQHYDIKAVFNLAAKRAESLQDVDYVMRRNAIDFALPLFNEPQTALLFAKALSAKVSDKLKTLESQDVVVPSEVRTWHEWIGQRPM